MTKLLKISFIGVIFFSFYGCSSVFTSKEEKDLDKQNLFMECKTFFGGRDTKCMRSALEKKMMEAKQEFECEHH